MRLKLLFAFALVCVTANDDVQYVKSVKGGHSGYRQYNPGAKLPNFYGNATNNYGGYGFRQNTTQQGYNTTNERDYEVGVCYIEVPTINLVHNQAHPPRGNGSRPDLSRVRSCCKGYIRNIHNFRICDPVCTQECVNALCTAPDTCSCFPDHVKNLAGFCIPTCPIGCQHGHCSGGECLCKEGFKLDSESKYCLPSCRENCGGIGNCTAPNACDCKKGYQSTPDGNCKPTCDSCVNGDCVAPNECRCKTGFIKDQTRNGDCVPQCRDNCAPNGKCVAPERCEYPEVRSTTPAISPPYQPSHHNNMPLYPGNQVYPGYQGNHENNTGSPLQPGSQNPRQPGSVQPGQGVYPGNQFYPGSYPYPGGQGYSGSQGHSEGHGFSSGNSNSASYPGNLDQDRQRYPGNEMNQGGQTYPGSQPYPGGQQYPGQRYPGNQQYPGQVQIYPGNHQYPGGQVYPGNQPYPGGQLYPGNQGSSYSGQRNTTSQQGSNGQEGFSGVQGVNQAQLYPDIQQYNQDFQVECSLPCINGYCVEGNKCRCNQGYVLDKTDTTETRCIPYCPGGCHNGICSAPNFCICNMGYYKDHSVKGRPQCVKRN